MERVVAISTVFGHGKTVVPSEVRKYLKLEDEDRINYVQDVDGRIYVEKGDRIEKHLGKYKA